MNFQCEKFFSGSPCILHPLFCRLMETNRQSISNLVEDVLMREETNQVSIPEELPSSWTANGIADNLSLLEHYLYGKISTR